MKKIKFKQENGITLIALIITIIIMLILVAVSINIIIKSDLFGAAQNAADKTKTAYEEEGKLGGIEIDGVKYNSIEEYINSKDGTYVDTTAPEIKDAKPGDITTDREGNPLSGTTSEPYQICSIEDLVAFADNVNTGNITSTSNFVALESTLNFKATASYVDSERTSLTTYALDGETELETHEYSNGIMVALTTGAGWEPIGIDSENGFLGTFDGKENELKNLYINYVKSENSELLIGLFSLNNGTIQNLNVTGSVTGTITDITDSWMCVGGILGENTGTIYNCNSSATVTGIQNNISNYLYIGGITGDLNGGTVQNCSNTGTVMGKTSKVSYIEEYFDIGGIVGTNYGGTVENCYNKGKIIAENCYGASEGGITGESYNGGSIIKCYNTGSITSTGIVNWINIGGIAGHNDIYSETGEVSNCYNIGTINTTNSNGVLKGGIIGYDGWSGEVTKNYDGSKIGAIGGQDFIGVAEYASLTEEKIKNYIKTGTTPASQTQTYAISELLKPGVYVEYDTTNLADLELEKTLTGCNYVQTVKPSTYTGGWQVLSNDGETVEIISSEVVDLTTKYLYLTGKTGYKNAVKTLNTAAGAFLNETYGESARSVGSTKESIETVTDTLSYKPTKYSNLTDMEFYKDFANMGYSGTISTPTTSWYWLASRYCDCYSDGCYFRVRRANEPGGWNSNNVFGIYSDGTSYSNGYDYGLRPVVSLKSELKITGGNGTSGAPYVLGV